MITQFEIECALMAGRAYQTNRASTEINWFPVPNGWIEFFHVPNPDYPDFNPESGFEATAFQSTTNPKHHCHLVRLSSS